MPLGPGRWTIYSTAAMADKILLTLAAFELLFLVTGGLVLGFSVASKHSLSKDLTVGNVAHYILLKETPTPLTAGIVNAVFIFVSFVFVLPAFFLRTNKSFLRLHGWAVVVSGTFTLILGLIIWIETLRTRNLLGNIWASEKPSTQNLLQEKVGPPLSPSASPSQKSRAINTKTVPWKQFFSFRDGSTSASWR